jgi:hypothetical protein
VSGARAQDSDKLNGIWDLTISPKNADSGTAIKKNPVVIAQRGDKLTILDFHAIDKPTEGFVKNNTAEIPVHLPTNRDGKEERFTLKGSLENGELVGSAMINNEAVEWKARRLASVWVCSNHNNPVHAAESEDSIRKLSKEFGCKGWHQLRSSNAQKIIAALTADHEKGAAAHEK